MSGGSDKGTEPASKHELVPVGSDPLRNYRAIIPLADGTADIVMPDSNGNDATLQYPVFGGMPLPVKPKYITAATVSIAGVW